MKGLQTLIKLHKTKIDAIIVKVNQLTNERILVEKDIALLISMINNEQKLYRNTEYTIFLENYLNFARKERDQYSKKLLEIERNIISLQNDLVLEFGDLKKIEILTKNRIKATKDALDRKEEIVLNDNILMKYNYDRKP